MHLIKELLIILNWVCRHRPSTSLRASLTPSWAELSLTPKNGNTHQAKVTSGRVQLSSQQHYMMVTDARLHRKSQKKAKLFHEMLFLLQFPYKYTVRKKSVNCISGPLPHPLPSDCLGNCHSIPLYNPTCRRYCYNVAAKSWFLGKPCSHLPMQL